MLAQVLAVESSLVAVLIGTVIPFLVSLVTKLRVSDGVRIAISAVLSAVGAGLAAIAGPGETVLLTKETALLFFMVFASNVVSYKSVGKTLQINEKIAPNKGLG